MHIGEVTIDGTIAESHDAVTIRPGVRRVGIRYTGVDLSRGPYVRFRYRMDTYDSAWTDVGTERTVSFTQLPAGRYRFRVIGRTGSGPWSPTEAGVDLLVLAPIYRRAWFLSAAALLLALLLWSAHRSQLRTRSAAIRDERSRLAREIHDSLLQGFGGAALELHVASTRLALAPPQQALLDRVLSLIDRTLAQARDVVSEIRQPGTATWNLAAACEEAGQRILGGTTVALRVEQRGRVNQLPAMAQSECVRVVEEALANIRRHAAAANVVVELLYRWREVMLTIRDDGVGFDPAVAAEASGHWGLLGMRERTSRIGGSLVVRSRPGSGTEVTLVVPLRRRLFRSRFGKD